MWLSMASSVEFPGASGERVGDLPALSGDGDFRGEDIA